MTDPREVQQTPSALNRRAFLAVSLHNVLGLSAFGAIPRSAAHHTDRRTEGIPPYEEPLATPSSELRSSYGMIVIGSGYGGAILAARLAPYASLCLLERGREWIPGTFPDALAAVAHELRTVHHPLGLYDYHSYDEVDVLVGCGLGGTSLINGNVVLWPADEVFDDPRWPEDIRHDRDRGVLDRYVAMVHAMLQVERYAGDLPALAKIEAHRHATSARGASFTMLDVAVNLRKVDDRPNHVGVHQRLCTLCGDCMTGCNVRAKNTLAMNYLPLAKQRGAQIFAQVEVEHLVKWPNGGYLVYYTHHPGNGQPPTQGVIHGRLVVLAAGALGSPQILLRSRDYGLSLSDALGYGFSGNGDLLGLGYNTEQRTDILGFGNHQDRRAHIRIGPAILSMADYRGNLQRSEQFLLEEGTIPRAFVDVLRHLAPVLAHNGEDSEAAWQERGAQVQRILRDLAGYHPQGALNHSMLYLGMGHDDANGMLGLDSQGHVRLRWDHALEQAFVRAIDQEMQAHTAMLGGTYLQHTAIWPNGKLITVHPLGGAIMGVNAERGVVDHRGRVYDPSQGLTAIHPGLYVADSSIVPTSLGVNPLLTIAALAERIAALIHEDSSVELMP